MTTMHESIAQPARHVLALPEDCDCGMCMPGWMRRRGKQARYSEPVSLADAMEREDRAAWPTPWNAKTALPGQPWSPSTQPA